uniref:Uncharacterized protein n=1 Tax=Arundo donax TaxID=35708 RepID=A0A0A9H9S5_ARUDO
MTRSKKSISWIIDFLDPELYQTWPKRLTYVQDII